MSEHGGESKSDRDRDLAAELRLRPERPPVTRLSRKVLMGLAAITAILISGALIWGLYQGQKKPAGGTELYNTQNNPTPDGLTALPRDYTGLPRNSLPPGVPPLGPPLPGDLGRPIRNAQIPVPIAGSPPSMPTSSAPLRKRKPRAPAACSPRRTPGSARRRRSLCRRRQPRTKPQGH